MYETYDLDEDGCFDMCEFTYIFDCYIVKFNEENPDDAFTQTAEEMIEMFDTDDNCCIAPAEFDYLT